MRTVVTIEGRRDHYSANECANNTTTVGKLISILESYDSDMPIMLNNDEGYTYGEIWASTIMEEDIESDED